jgi:hypothetical protein
MHEANHPGTRHIRNNIWQIDPKDVCDGRPVELAWFSPTASISARPRAASRAKRASATWPGSSCFGASGSSPTSSCWRTSKNSAPGGRSTKRVTRSRNGPGKPSTNGAANFASWATSCSSANCAPATMARRPSASASSWSRAAMVLPIVWPRADARASRQRRSAGGQAQAVAHRRRNHRLVAAVPVDLRTQEAAGRKDAAAHRARHRQVRAEQSAAVHRADHARRRRDQGASDRRTAAHGHRRASRRTGRRSVRTSPSFGRRGQGMPPTNRCIRSPPTAL